ncbi:MAG TPA: alpha/beta hydrolase [Caldimonas sp.]|nr:alpha/beta hydrolase [Caldimonas sp.]
MSIEPRGQSYGAHVRANEIRQHYLRFPGAGQALIVVPGITSPAATWDFVGERLGRIFDTYVLDVRGRGLSQGGSDLSYDLDTCASDVEQFASALGLRDFALLGHSMGGRIALRLAGRGGTAISRLVLADPPLSGPGRRPYGRSLDFYLEAIRRARAGTLDAEAVRQTYPRWSDAQLRSRAQWLHTCDETAVAASVRGFQEDDIHVDFARLHLPTLLLAAGSGGVVSDEDAAEVLRLMPSLEIRRLASAGHMLPFDDLEGFLAIAGEFLKRN